jgi:hypothetical protein
LLKSKACPHTPGGCGYRGPLPQIIEYLQQDEAFPSATSFREQCFDACCILREEHTPDDQLEFIG